jgi:hypothetical protein
LLDQAFTARQENQERRQELSDRPAVDDQPLILMPTNPRS